MVVESMQASKEEIQYRGLLGKWIKADNPDDEKLAKKEVDKFRHEHPVLVDEIQSRRWLIS
jgi:hypothetical protein